MDAGKFSPVVIEGQPRRLRIDAGGKVVPGDEPAEGDWRSLAQARNVPQPKGDYIETGGSRLAMNQDDLLLQAAGGYPAAIMRAMRIERENAINRANAVPRSQQEIDQIAYGSDAAFMKATGLSDAAFKADTERGQAGVQEHT